MIKKSRTFFRTFIWTFLFLATAFPAGAGLFWGGDYGTGNQVVTTVSDAWTLVSGSAQPATETLDSNFTFRARAWQVACDDDLKIGWSASPGSNFFLWKASYGPFQTVMIPPASGIYVALTYSATASVYYESKK